MGIWVGSILFLLCVLAAGCSAERHPNVVLITMDTTRRDHLSVYGYERPTTPKLLKLADAGVRLDNAYAPTPTTAPSHASIFTALHPRAHGVLKNGIRLRSDGMNLAEKFRNAGYQTAGFVSSFVLTSKFGWARGFDTYDDRFTATESSGGGNSFVWEGQRVFETFDRRADHTARRAIDWLETERDAERPFFLFAHFFDPHDPYRPPAAYAKRFEMGGASSIQRSIGRYDAEIAFTDLEIGVLLDALDEQGLAATTLVVVTADHGEGLLDHGHMTHGAQLYEEAVRVPLILRFPSVLPPGGVVAAPVSLVDLAPTLFELAGLGFDATGLHGSSFAGLLLMGDDADARIADGNPAPVFLYRRPYDGEVEIAGRHPRGEAFGLREGRWKYIEGPDEGTRELYDLSADPEEQRNVASQYPKRAERLADRLHEWRRTVIRPQAPPLAVSPEDRARLRELGYVD